MKGYEALERMMQTNAICQFGGSDYRLDRGVLVSATSKLVPSSPQKWTVSKLPHIYLLDDSWRVLDL